MTWSALSWRRARCSPFLITVLGSLATLLLCGRFASAEQPRVAKAPSPPSASSQAMTALVSVDLPPPNCTPVWLIDAEGIHRLADRCSPPTTMSDAVGVSAPTLEAGVGLSASPPLTKRAPSDLCDPPWFFDPEAGIRRVLLECLDDERVTVSEQPAVPSVGGPPKYPCDPPYYVDARGIRRLRPQCF